MIYLDNGATTNKKPFIVKKTILKCILKKYCVNPNRSGYKLSNNLSSKILKVREDICNHFCLKETENCIFTSGCTEALNLAILSSYQKGGHVIATSYEHNSVLRPLYKLKQEKIIDLTIVLPEKDGTINLNKIKKSIKPNTYLICANFTSNVTGYTNDIFNIGKICKDNNLLFLVDCAQSGGHEHIDINKYNIDFLSIAGHKGFYSLTGIGALLVSNKGKQHLKPIKFGGTGTKSDSFIQPTDFPDGYESGTCNVSGILTLGAGVQFVNKNLNKINKKISCLTEYLLNKLKEIKNITLYPSNNKNSGVVSFNIKGVSSNDVGNYLNENYNICVRTGLHCAPLVHKFYNTLNCGMVRVSLSYFNNKKDINKLIYALNNFINLT